MHHDFTIQTTAGTLTLTPTEKTHIYVRHTDPGAEFNGVRYSISAHYHFWGGQWQIGPQYRDNTNTQEYTPWERNMNHFYMRRLDRFQNDHPSESAKNKAMKLVTEQVQQWAAKNLLALATAELEYTQSRVDKKQEEITEAAKLVERLTADLYTLNDHLHLMQKLVASMTPTNTDAA